MSFYDDDSGYSTDDPKHANWHGTMSDLWDNRDKTRPAPLPVPPIVDRDPGDEDETA